MNASVTGTRDQTVCGQPRAVCSCAWDIGWEEFEAENINSYDLFSCDTPDNEPSCEPFRPDEYDGVTGPAADGDGVEGDDNCPTIFNPVRLVDVDGFQADFDGVRRHAKLTP